MGNQSARLSLKQLETTQDTRVAKATLVCGWKSNWEVEKLQWEQGQNCTTGEKEQGMKEKEIK